MHGIRGLVGGIVAIELFAAGAALAARPAAAASNHDAFATAPGIEVGVEDGALRTFRVETPEGVLWGSVEPHGPEGLPAATMRAAGSPDVLSVALYASAGRTEVVVDFGTTGAIRYRTMPDGEAEPVAVTIDDCGAIERHATFRVVRAAIERLDAVAEENARAFASPHPAAAGIRVLLALAERAPEFVRDCVVSQVRPGFCSQNTSWEEDCEQCCEFFYGITSVGARVGCAAAAAALCSPSGPMSVACAAGGAMACAAVVHFGRAQCIGTCAPKPRKPLEGEACSTTGVCRDRCAVDEKPGTGTCAAGLVCCAPDPDFP